MKTLQCLSSGAIGRAVFEKFLLQKTLVLVVNPESTFRGWIAGQLTVSVRASCPRWRGRLSRGLGNGNEHLRISRYPILRAGGLSRGKSCLVSKKTWCMKPW